MKLEYDPDKEEYRVDDKVVPRVTEIIPKPKFWVNADQLVLARQDGIEKHGLIKLYYDNACDTFGNIFLENLHNVLTENNFGNLLHYEKSLFSEKHNFAGTPDIVYDNALIDFKRGKGDEKIWALQLAGYSILLSENGIHIPENWYIIFGNGEKLKIKKVYDNQAKNIFLALRKKYDIDQAVEAYLKS